MSAARTERLLNLLTLLLNASQPVSLAEICALDAFDAYCSDDPKSGERAFERDKAALVALGVPLVWVAGDADDDREAGYSIERGRYFLEPVDLTAEQRALLSIAGAATATLNGYAGQAALRRALAKLGFDASSAPAAPYPMLAHAPLAVGTEVVRVAEHLDILHQAMAGLRQVQLQYADDKNEPSPSRPVDPYGLYYQHGVWYLVGFCHRRGAMRTFHLGRVRRLHVHPCAQTFVLPADFDIRQAAQLRSWQYPKEAAVDVVIRLAERLVPAVDEIFGPTALVHYDATGPWLQLKVTHIEGFIACILPLGAAAEVITPADLRAHLRGLYAQLSRVYQATSPAADTPKWAQ